jgi:hypothetical protein
MPANYHGLEPKAQKPLLLVVPIKPLPVTIEHIKIDFDIDRTAKYLVLNRMRDSLGSINVQPLVIHYWAMHKD